MRKKWRDRIEKVEREVQYANDKSMYGKALEKDNYIECEKCGCLIKKEEKHKLASTIEIQEIANYTPHTYTYPGMTPIYYTQKKETIKEHFQCGRCKDA